jgi:hypothetical protein
MLRVRSWRESARLPARWVTAEVSADLVLPIRSLRTWSPSRPTTGESARVLASCCGLRLSFFPARNIPRPMAIFAFFVRPRR